MRGVEGRLQRLMKDNAHAIERARERAERGPRWHHPITLPFVHAFEAVDLWVMRWRITRLERAAEKRERA